jgi:CheY-like chemotaxis protein
MKKASNSQHKQQQLSNFTASSSSDSSGLDNSTMDAVSKNEKQENREKKRILLVDDEPDITYTLSRVLEDNGFSDVDVYNEPLLIVENFKSCIYSLLITDIAMPGMNGFELYENIKKIDSKIKVIFMTASTVNYEALNELLPIAGFGTSYQNKEETISQKIQEGSGDEHEGEYEEKPCIIRKPVEIRGFVQRVNNEFQNSKVVYSRSSIQIS